MGHFPENTKPLPVEESVVIAPTVIAEVESTPDTKDKISDHFAERERKDKGEEEKLIIKPYNLPEKADIEPEVPDEDEEKKRKKVKEKKENLLLFLVFCPKKRKLNLKRILTK